MSDEISEAEFLKLFEGNLVPLRVVLGALTWVLYDYFVTVKDEIKYIWPQKFNFSKFMFFWIRYYTIILLVFDTTQIHLFARPGITSNVVCVAMDPVTRIAGAISLWSVEIIMQKRIYALFNCSNKVAIFNGFLFLASICAFFWIVVHGALQRNGLIWNAVHLPIPGCPTVNAGIQWALWVPATAYEGILFGFVFYNALVLMLLQGRFTTGSFPRLYRLFFEENVLYFSGISCLLVFNNLMVVGLTHIPWFSFGPFHAAIGILTTRMLIHLRKISDDGNAMRFANVCSSNIGNMNYVPGNGDTEQGIALPDLTH